MEPCLPRAPPSPERCPVSPSSPGPLAPQPPPRLGRHLLIDSNGVPYMYTVRLDEEQPQRELEAPQGEAAGGMGAPAQGYRCPECFQVFKSPLYLKRHGISHSDLRPYVCGVCAKTFKRSSSLCQHRLTHRTRGSRAHACPLCPRRFLDARELAQHIRGH
ncbi:zinc finger protein 580-like isoform X2 [Phascolarctos cinereus]|nr:zinc finger protein 580-like isoform X2 [Phascolarctos cinereus]XP_020859742.1 zinc finger protein 580-like isoform X2 [Phascolarctos cinereus]XP_020859743.1 zinc finger protein 580-like isoform X2 [Phascolarctos cinereus]XP_020859744.1 zinc finger protein 580-like isoform X2 [Phascolarctos cinereus]